MKHFARMVKNESRWSRGARFDSRRNRSSVRLRLRDRDEKTKKKILGPFYFIGENNNPAISRTAIRGTTRIILFPRRLVSELYPERKIYKSAVLGTWR